MSDTTLVLRGGTVVDPRTGSVTSSADVVIQAGAITAVHPAPVAEAGPAVRVVDVTGRWIVPGYEEMHAHPLEDATRGAYELMTAHGISGFRQMSGSIELLRRRAAGQLSLPELAPTLRQMPGPLLLPFNGSTSEKAVAAIREQAEAGADFVKSGMLSSAVFVDAQAEAIRLGIPLCGHLPSDIDVEAVSRAGLGTIEHLGPGAPLVACCSTHDHEIREALRARPGISLPDVKIPLLGGLVERLVGAMIKKIVVNPTTASRHEDIVILAQAVATFDRSRARSLAERFAEDGTWNVPTLIRMKAQYFCDSPDLTESSDLRFVPPKVLKRWKASNKRFASFSTEDRATLRAAYERLLELTAELDDVGAPLLAGSDVCGAGWLVPGLSFHRELDELARAGLSPLRVLQIATSEAGRYLGSPDTIGTVTTGANADLVVLDADPLVSVEHLHRIRAVVRNGHYISRGELDALLARAEQEEPAY